MDLFDASGSDPGWPGFLPYLRDGPDQERREHAVALKDIQI